MANLIFKCPECKGTHLEEIMVDVLVASDVTDIQPDGFVEYGEQTNHGGEVKRYQCETCGYTIKDDQGWDIVTPEEMYKVASKKGWINNA